MPVEIEKIVILSAAFSPVAIASVVFAREVLGLAAGTGQVFRVIPSTVGAALGLVLVGLLIGPQFHVIDRTIELSSLPNSPQAIGAAVAIAYSVALLFYLGSRGTRGRSSYFIFATAPVLSALPFLAIQFFAVEVTRFTSPDPLIIKNPSGAGVSALASVERVADGLSFVTSLTSDSMGRILFTEFRSGRIQILEPQGDGTFKQNSFARVRLPESLFREQGLWHVALDPDEIYAYVSAVETTIPDKTAVSASATSRVVRFPYNDGKAGPMEVVLPGLPAGQEHSGGAMTFGPDGSLYLSVGDTGSAPLAAQDPQVNLEGSILRLTPEGEIPQDNPFVDSRVYAYGFRNPYGIAFNQETGQMYATDNGPSCCDRVLRVERGRFHGWPEYGHEPGDTPSEGSDPTLVPPLVVTGSDDRYAPTQLLWYGGDRYGPEFKGNLFFGTFLRGDLRRLVLTGDGLTLASEDTILEFTNPRAITSITTTPDGFIYFATSGTGFHLKGGIYLINSFGAGE